MIVKVLIFDHDQNPHHIRITDVESKEEAEILALNQIAEKLNVSVNVLEVLTSVEEIQEGDDRLKKQM